jgi:hypothetical protein
MYQVEYFLVAVQFSFLISQECFPLERRYTPVLMRKGGLWALHRVHSLLLTPWERQR